MTDPATPALPCAVVESRHAAQAAALLSAGYDVVPLDQANGQLTGRPLLVWLSDPAAELSRLTELCKAASSAKLLRFPKGDMPPAFAGTSFDEFCQLAKPNARLWTAELEVELLREMSERIVAEGERERQAYLAAEAEKERIARLRNGHDPDALASPENGHIAGPVDDSDSLIPDVPDDAADVALASVLEAERASVVFSIEHDPDAWPAPADLWGGAHLPDVRPEWLPAPIAVYALDQSALIGNDPAQAAINCTTACAALIHEGIGLQMMAESERWVERARVWGAVVGDPSTKKGPALEAATGYLKHLAGLRRASDEAALTEFTHQTRLYENELQSYYRKARDQPGMQRPTAPERPASNRLWTDDTTKEKLAVILSSHARGKMTVIKDELAAWFGSFDAYGNGRSDKDRPDWLSAYEGKERYIDRVGEGRSIHVPSWSVCILGGIQPSVLAGIAAKLGQDGMLQRFQLACSRPATEGEERRPDVAAVNRWQRVMANLLEMVPAGSQMVRFSPDAQAFRSETARWINKAMRSGLSAHVVAALGKWEGLFGRLVLTAHCINCADEGLPFPREQIPLSTAQQVWAYMVELLWPHALHFYDGVLNDQGLDAKTPIRWLAGAHILQGKSEISTSELSREWSGYRHLKTPAQRKEFFDSLVTAGWIKPHPTRPGMDISGKMPTRYVVNPAVHDGRFAEQQRMYAAERLRYKELMPGKMPNRFRDAGED